MTVRLDALNIYPVKGCRRNELAVAELGARGLDGDREWLVTRPDGTFLSQRTHPGLARLVPTRAGARLELECPGLASLVVEPFVGGESREVVVWRDRMQAWDAGEPAAEWLTRALGVPARLARFAPETRRMADRRYVGAHDVPLTFADGYPLLVCTTASLAELNRRLPIPVPMERFRPNLVLDGLQPFAEDRIKAVRVGAVTLRFVKPCTRCVVPSIDQTTGLRSTDPTPALKAFRYDPALQGVVFGVNAVVDGPRGATLAVGAEAEVIA